jgi:Tfp pilus assembly protein PilF
MLVSLLRDNSFREADKLAAALLADPAADAQAQAICGLAVLKAGHIREAEAIFDKAISISPDNPEAHLGLGRNVSTLVNSKTDRPTVSSTSARVMKWRAESETLAGSLSMMTTVAPGLRHGRRFARSSTGRACLLSRPEDAEASSQEVA